MSIRLHVSILLVVVTHVTAASAAEPPRIARGGEAWLQDDLADGKSRDKFSPATRNTGHLHVRAEDDGGESALIYTWKAGDGAPGPVTFEPNGGNAARDAKFTYRVQGWYTLEVTVTDKEGLSTASRVEIYLDDFSCYEDGAGRRIWYSLVRPQDPKGYDSDKKYPLVINFHGGSPRGERHNNHSDVTWIEAKAQRQQPYFYVSPGCPAKSAEGKRYQNWLDRDFYLGSAPMPDLVTAPVRLALEMLDDLIERYPIDGRRLVITGASNGGYATWDIICRHPDKFMAAIPVCGGGDTLPPVVGRVIAAGDPTGMKVVFSEQVNRDDARSADNYHIDGVTVQSASLAEDNRTVTLVTSPLSADAVPTKHSLRVAGVRDTAASPRTTDDGLAFEFTFDPRLVAWWKLDETGGDRVTDASGNGHHGTVQGKVQWTRGRIGGAIQLDGKDGFVELGDILNDVNFPVTMSAWLKYDGPPIEKDRLAPIFFSDDIRDARRWAGFWLALYEDARPGGGFGTTRLGQHRKAIANQPVRLDTWTHLAVTIASPNELRVYVNGRAVEADQSRPFDVSRISPWDEFPPRKWDNIPARIGRLQIREEPGAVFFSGAIDDVRVYSRALSAAEIQGVFAAAD